MTRKKKIKKTGSGLIRRLSSLVALFIVASFFSQSYVSSFLGHWLLYALGLTVILVCFVIIFIRIGPPSVVRKPEKDEIERILDGEEEVSGEYNEERANAGEDRT